MKPHLICNMKLPKPEPKFKVGQKVIVNLPRDDIEYEFDGMIGVIDKMSDLSALCEYKIKFDTKSKEGVYFLESSLEEYSSEKIIERTIGLKCPDCGQGVIEVIPHNDDKINVKVVIFECLFSATFNMEDSLNEMQQKLDEAKKTGKLKDLRIK